jgi:purine-nucleoside phosphorylase
MNNEYIVNRLNKSSNFIKQLIEAEPKVAIVSGSHSINIEDNMQNCKKINYADIPNFPVSTVKGHDGYLMCGIYNNKSILLLKGRFHYYEGYPMTEVTYYVRVLALLGVKKLILTNAAGAINNSFKPGDIMLIKDHIGLFMPVCPLRGKNISAFGKRFPDMTYVYDRESRNNIEKIAQKNNIKLRQGIYAYLQGPRYETPSEIKLLELLKVDVVGMSTVPEAIVAKHCGIDVVGFSLITNMAAGISKDPLSHEDVLKISAQSGDDINKILFEMLSK